MTQTETAATGPLQTSGETPALLDVFHLSTSTHAVEWAPMTEERRTELTEDLIAWSKDETGLDWAFVNSLD